MARHHCWASRWHFSWLVNLRPVRHECPRKCAQVLHNSFRSALVLPEQEDRQRSVCCPLVARGSRIWLLYLSIFNHPFCPKLTPCPFLPSHWVNSPCSSLLCYVFRCQYNRYTRCAQLQSKYYSWPTQPHRRPASPPRSPRPRMREPLVTTEMRASSLCGQLRRICLILPLSLMEMNCGMGWDVICQKHSAGMDGKEKECSRDPQGDGRFKVRTMSAHAHHSPYRMPPRQVTMVH